MVVKDHDGSNQKEGTIIAALLVGFIARLFGKHLGFIKAYLFPEEQNAEQSKATDTENIQNKNVIVIGRQYGSGGHDIGKMLADKINKACFRRVALAN